jgi:hypothetical protein
VFDSTNRNNLLQSNTSKVETWFSVRKAYLTPDNL